MISPRRSTPRAWRTASDCSLMGEPGGLAEAALKRHPLRAEESFAQLGDSCGGGPLAVPVAHDHAPLACGGWQPLQISLCPTVGVVHVESVCGLIAFYAINPGAERSPDWPVGHRCWNFNRCWNFGAIGEQHQDTHTAGDQADLKRRFDQRRPSGQLMKCSVRVGVPSSAISKGARLPPEVRLK